MYVPYDWKPNQFLAANAMYCVVLHFCAFTDQGNAIYQPPANAAGNSWD